MQSAPIPSNEQERLQSLQQYQLLDTLPEDVYDDITRLASEITGTPVSLITMVDKDRQWFKSRHNFPMEGSPRDISFCAHAILLKDDIMIVSDARYDERFHDNPFTQHEPPVIFYAGVPLTDSTGNALGTLCVIDHRPRELSDQQTESLKALAKLVKTHFELRKVKLQLARYEKTLTQARPMVDAALSDLLPPGGQPAAAVSPAVVQKLADLQKLLATPQ